MAKILTDLQTELNNRVDESIDSDTSTSWLNDAWQEAVEYFPWPFRRGRATGTLAGSTADQTWSGVFSVTNFARLAQFIVNNVSFDRVDYQDKDITGQSQVIALLPDHTGFVTPGSETGTATLHYIKSVSDLSTGSDTLTSVGTVPAAYVKFFEESVVAGAASRYFQQALKPSMADYWEAKRDFYLDQVIDQITRGSENDSIALRTVEYNESGTTSEF